MSKSRLIPLVLMISIFVLPALAQVENSSIVGTVVTADGSILPGVTVTLRCKCATRCPGDCSCCPAARQYVTDEKGQFHFSAILPGDYDVSAEMAGFATATAKVTIGSGEVHELTLRMSTGGVTVTIDPCD